MFSGFHTRHHPAAPAAVWSEAPCPGQSFHVSKPETAWRARVPLRPEFLSKLKARLQALGVLGWELRELFEVCVCILPLEALWWKLGNEMPCYLEMYYIRTNHLLLHF